MSENLWHPQAFTFGEVSPNLWARMDLKQMHAGAALMRNFFVDYRGGASTRFGTRYCLTCLNSAAPVRVIRFQPSFTIAFALEFGQNYIRFYQNGGPVLEATTTISGVNTGTGVLTITSSGYAVGNWIYVASVVGVTGINGNYYIVTNVTGSAVTVTDLYGNAPVWGGSYTSGGTAQRVYTLQSPYAGSDLALLKFAQNVQTMVLCHPNYPAYILTYNGATSWTLTQITYGTTIQPPTSLSVSSSGGSGNYAAYVVTSIDSNGQESAASAILYANDVGYTDEFTNTSTISWTQASGAVSYNIYRTSYNTDAQAVTGAQFGFMQNVPATAASWQDCGFSPDFDLTPPVVQNPFLGGPVASVTITTAGSYTAVPTVTFAAPSSGYTALGTASLGITAVGTITNGGFTYSVGQTVNFPSVGATLVIASVNGSGTVTAFEPLTYPGTSVGSITSGSTPSNPVEGNPTHEFPVSVDLTWGVISIAVNFGGLGYTSAPSVSFSSGSAAGTAVLGQTSAGNPQVPAYFQQRLVLASQAGAQQTFYMSQPGSPYNFNTTDPTQDDNAITGSIISGQLNNIKSLIPVPTGLIALTSSSAWLINGGGTNAPVTPENISANSQAYNGASDVPPLLIDYDILYVQSKGSIIRDLSYNFYANIFTGQDISLISQHLFYGYQIKEWAYAEEPFKVVWAVRSDGRLLSLSFVKAQELSGWAHHDTQGYFQSVCTITEQTLNQTSFGAEISSNDQTFTKVDAVYLVVQRIINGQTLQYVERMADRYMPYNLEDAWCLDSAIATQPYSTPATTLTAGATSGNGVTFTAGASAFTSGMIGWFIRMGGGVAVIQTYVSATEVTANITQDITAILPDSGGTPSIAQSGNWTIWEPLSTFTGLASLNGMTVSALGDGVAYSGLTVSNGSVSLPSGTASKVVIGLPFTPQLQTLYMDAGEPTIQGKRKKIGAITIREKDSYGLYFGRTFDTLVQLKETGPPTLATPNQLVTADVWQPIDPIYDEYGQICIQQKNPWPSTVLGIIPEVTIGDSAK